VPEIQQRRKDAFRDSLRPSSRAAVRKADAGEVEVGDQDRERPRVRGDARDQLLRLKRTVAKLATQFPGQRLRGLGGGRHGGVDPRARDGLGALEEFCQQPALARARTAEQS
jgi:hypothetical protein